MYKDLTMDHIIPQFLGGRKEWENIVTACKKCNERKGHKKIEETSMFLLTTPKKPAITIREYYRYIPFPDSWERYI
tara:strand:+ start:350 stop:577 length:228 start_codon:yes stop_codon:yes gene_type:complete